MTIIYLGVVSVIVFGVVLLVLYLGVNLLQSDELSVRLKRYVVEENDPSRRMNGNPTAMRRELSGSFLKRTLLPFTREVGQLLGRMTPKNSIEDLKRQLLVAGNPLGLGAQEFYGLRIAFLIIGTIAAFLILRNAVDRVNILLSASVVILCYLFPVLWLRAMVRSRQNLVRRGLPDALDMLSVCADSGLGFDQSLLRVSESWKTPISQEFGRVVAEMEMGVSRRDALRGMADRLEVSEISSFISIILQSEQIGMSIADTLHAQAEQMRIERRFRAQELARTIPIKMLVPLAFLIFPAIIAVILGPAVPQLLDLFKNF